LFSSRAFLYFLIKKPIYCACVNVKERKRVKVTKLYFFAPHLCILISSQKGDKWGTYIGRFVRLNAKLLYEE